jgi:hypothetical protein
MAFRHNKKKNTLFIYEVLIRELTRCILKEDKAQKKEILNIIKTFFAKDKPLAKEIELYRILSETTDLKEGLARKLLSETLRVYSNFNHNDLQQEQEKLLAQVNEKTDSESLFTTFIPSYRNLASIYQIFNRKMNPKEKVILEERIVESLMSSPKLKEEEKFNPIGNLEFKTFLNSFNEVYSGTLIKEQQELLTRYVLSSTDDGTELKIYLNEEISRLKGAVKGREELKEVLQVLENFQNQPISTEVLSQVLRVQDLVSQLENK